MTMSDDRASGAASPSDVMHILEALGLSVIVATSLETGLFERLFAKADTAAEHARALGLDPRATALTLEALVASGFAMFEGGQYSLSRLVVDAVARAPGGPMMLFGMWRHTPAFLKWGEPYLQMDRGPRHREDSYKGIVAALGRMFEPAARQVAALVAPRIGLEGKAHRVLDVGCGSGVWSLAVAERIPVSRVTGLDLPAVLDAFEERASGLGFGDRVATIAGDMHAASIPRSSFDLAVLANVLRLETKDRAASLVRRVAAGVAEDGALLVVDALARGTRSKEISRTVYAMNLAMRTMEGGVHAPDEVYGWLRNAGFSHIEQLDVDAAMGGHGALLARR
jgi:ubiquinone/menaquinone biosynthesis C-methylase UbiE